MSSINLLTFQSSSASASASASILLLLLIVSSLSDHVNCGVNLERSLIQLENYVKNLTIKLHETELRLSKVEDNCNCVHGNDKLIKSSSISSALPTPLSLSLSSSSSSSSSLSSSCLLSNGSYVLSGHSWDNLLNCSKCTCSLGVVNCDNRIDCPSLGCKLTSSYFPSSTDCCPICHKKCLKDGKYIEHGDVYIKDCVKCVCDEGSLRCKKINPLTHCPPLDCPVDLQFKKDGECCKYCMDYDWCAKGRHDCHENANCYNLKTEFTCKCKNGYWGNGKQCYDINECSSLGGINGNLCRDNTKCINTNGSYYCQCLPGFKRRDDLNCVDIDECASNEHKCNKNSKCINTEGDYKCQCLPGYTGNGFNCHPICNKKCANGGKCIGPDKCQCKRGFYGQFCQLDIDECQLNIDQCPVNSKCINKPGWYSCECLSGYSSTINDHNHLKCVDINECNEGTDTCDHETTICVNTEGSYSCQCASAVSTPSTSTSKCSNDCLVNGQKYNHNSKWELSTDPCYQCTCTFGVTNCSIIDCNCNQLNADQIKSNCCPQCDLNKRPLDCFAHSIKRKHGDKWLMDNCKSCQCLFGEVNCSHIDCPPVQCSNAIKLKDDCCLRCEDDPCDDYIDNDENKMKPGISIISINSTISSTSSSSSSSSSNVGGCMYLDKLYSNGDKIEIKKDPCASCKCKNGRLCCAYDANCISDSSSMDKANLI